MDRTTRVGAYGLVVRPRQILLCRVSARVTKWAGWWTLPGGGVDFGEDPKTAMVREVREETGLDVRSAGVAGVDSLVVPGEARTTHSLRIIYFTEVLGGALANEVNGSTDLCEWHDLEAVFSIPAVGLVDTALSLL